MKTTYTDKELQKAIDDAFPLGNHANYSNLDTYVSESNWPEEAPSRLAIAKAFLEKLQFDPYAELKKVHAEGAAIQYTDDNLHAGRWQDCTCPSWVTASAYHTNPRYRLKPPTLEAHGKTWTRHTPGDAMPCDGEAMVNYILRTDWPTCATIRKLAKNVRWADVKDNPVIGWRYADEPTPPVETPWTPAIGDVVQLKSGGPKMTICKLEGGKVRCTYFAGIIIYDIFQQACLTPVTE